MPLQVHFVGVAPHNRRRVATMALLLGAVVWRLAWMGYTPLHLRPRPMAHAAEHVDTSGEPVQAPLEGPARPIAVRRHGQLAIIEKVATYSIAAQVVAMEPYYTDALSVVSPVDLTLAWGPLLTPPVRQRLKFGHFDRHGTYGWRGEPPLPRQVLASHFSNNHLVPASARLRDALLSVSPGDDVLLQGHLINVSITGGGAASTEMNSSQTRTDEGDGACEIVYVESLQIGHDVYQ